jgi:hypothetical protein
MRLSTIIDGKIGILHDKLKVVYTLLILCFGSEIGNLKLEKYKDVDALPNFKFPVSTSAFNSIIHAFSKKV